MRIRVGLRSNPNRFEGWAHVNGFSWHKLRLHIPENESLRRELVRRHYGLPFAGHFAERTSDLLGRKYYGKGMRQYVEEYYRAYGVCQDSRVLCGKIQGELQPLEALTEQLADTSIREIALFSWAPSTDSVGSRFYFANEFWRNLLHALKVSRDTSTGIPFTERRSD